MTLVEGPTSSRAESAGAEALVLKFSVLLFRKCIDCYSSKASSFANMQTNIKKIPPKYFNALFGYIFEPLKKLHSKAKRWQNS